MSKKDGRFEKGNEIGKETRFKEGNMFSVKYKDEYCEELIAFFAEPEEEILYSESFYQDGSLKSRVPIVMPPKFPTFELFAAKLHVVPNTLLNWCEKHPRFASAYALAKNMQLGIVKRGAMMKQYDSNFAKFVLVNDHDLKDKSERDTSVTLDVVLSDEIDEESN